MQKASKSAASKSTTPMIKLQSSDNEVFEVDIEIAKASITIKTMLENLGMDDIDEVIPITKVNSTVLGKVLEWATYHKDDPPPVESPIVSRMPSTDLDPWDKEFLDVDQTMLFELIIAANYLDIKSLYDAGCKAVANIIKGKTPEEIRSVMGIQNDFTPEEEERIKMENKWSEEKPEKVDKKKDE